MAYEDRHPSPGDMLKLLSWVESFPIIPALLIYTRIVSAPCMVEVPPVSLDTKEG